MAWVEAAFAKYGWIWIGLSVGFLAKYALLIKRGIRIRPWLVVADVLLLPLVALIAYWMIGKAGAEGETAALLTAFCTVGADRLVKLLTERFFRQVETEVGDVANRVVGQVRQEVQAELSGENIKRDFLIGKAPEDYRALDPHPKPGGAP